MAGKFTFIRYTILLIEGQRTIEMHHTEEFTTLDFAKMTLTKREGGTNEAIFGKLLQTKLGSMLSYTTNMQYVINDQRVGM